MSCDAFAARGDAFDHIASLLEQACALAVVESTWKDDVAILFVAFALCPSQDSAR